MNDDVNEFKKAKRRAKTIINSAKSEADKITSKVALDIEETAIAQIKEMSKRINEQTIASAEAVKAELDAYKKQKMVEIDREVKEMVTEISKKLIGEAIDLRTHEELVIRALEDAKRSGLL